MKYEDFERVKEYLNRASNSDPPGMSEEIIDEACSQFRKALVNKFNEAHQGFTIRMSNVGKPLCQLQKEAGNSPKEDHPYNFAMQMLIGDTIEAIAIAIIKAAGVP